MHIYKGYTQQELDQQYNARAAVQDFGKILQDWERRSGEYRKVASINADVEYGSGAREKLDLFPASSGNGRLLVFFHGGYWQALDKRVFHFLAKPFADQGVAVAIVNYPLAPAAGMDQIVRSCRTALVRLYTHADDLGFDRSRIFVSGHSAGGHMVGMLMATEWNEWEGALPGDLIKGGFAISGLFDLRPIRLTYLNQVLGMDEGAASRNSPVLLSPAAKAPLLACVGELESDEFKVQSADITQIWSQQGMPVERLEVGGTHHFSILDQLTDRNSKLHQEVLKRMEIRV